MSVNLFFDDRLRQFWKELYTETTDMEAFEKNTIRALNCIADPLRLGEVKAILDAPATKFRLEGVHYEAYFFQRQENVGESIYEADYPGRYMFNAAETACRIF